MCLTGDVKSSEVSAHLRQIRSRQKSSGSADQGFEAAGRKLTVFKLILSANMDGLAAGAAGAGTFVSLVQDRNELVCFDSDSMCHVSRFLALKQSEANQVSINYGVRFRFISQELKLPASGWT